MPQPPCFAPQDTTRRNLALLSLDRQQILAYLWDTADPAVYESFANAPEDSFWRMIHLTRLFIKDLPHAVRRESLAWLRDHSRGIRSHSPT